MALFTSGDIGLGLVSIGLGLGLKNLVLFTWLVQRLCECCVQVEWKWYQKTSVCRTSRHLHSAVTRLSVSVCTYFTATSLIYCFTRHSLAFMPETCAPCGLRGCKNRPAPFPGRMSYKATKPSSVCPLSWPRFVFFLNVSVVLLLTYFN